MEYEHSAEAAYDVACSVQHEHDLLVRRVDNLDRHHSAALQSLGSEVDRLCHLIVELSAVVDLLRKALRHVGS